MKSAAFLSLALALPLCLIPLVRSDASWTEDVRLTETSGRSGLSEGNARSISLDSAGRVHVVWHDDTQGNYDVFYFTADSLQVTPVTPRNLTSNLGASLDPSVVVVGDSLVVVVWVDDSETPFPSVMFARFFPSADTVLNYGRVSTSTFACSDPCVAASSDSSLHIVWSQNAAELSDIFYRKWSGDWVDVPLNLSVNASTSVNASVAIDGEDDIHVAWADNIPGNYEIFYKKHTDGSGWSSSVQVSDSQTLAWSPSMGADSGGNAYVVWSDRKNGNFEIYFRRFMEGVGWSARKRVTYNAAISANPSLSVDCVGNMYIVWEEFRDGNDEIYYRKITNSQGPGWDPVETRLTQDGATSWDASVAADSSGKVHVLWADSREGNFEIYYKYGDNPIPVGLDVLSFNAECIASGVRLSWELSSDGPAPLVDVFRSAGEGACFDRLTQVSLLGQTEFLDTDVVDGATYRYSLGIWLGEQEDYALFGPLNVKFSPPVAALATMRVWPNPAKAKLTVEFAAGGRILPFKLSLLDVRGRMVSEMATGETSEGVTSVPCDVASRLGRKLAPGIYLVSLEIAGERLEKKIVLLK
jgi:hypothetical protein